MTRVELFETIKRAYVLKHKSIRQCAREYGVHRRDVRRAIAGEGPAVRRRPERASRVLGPYRDEIDSWLRADLAAPRKQRHTGRRVWRRLVGEHGFTGAESTVRRYVGRRRRELGLTGREVFIEQEYQPGQEAQVDFGEAQVVLGGVESKVYLLLVRCCYSGRTVVVACRRQTQQCFLEALGEALEEFGGVFSRLRFDNLKPAVRRVLRGRKRLETERFVSFRAHYLFDAEFCRPGIAGAHEKGGVEGEVGRFRRNHLVPMPSMADLGAFNAWLLQEARADLDRWVVGQKGSVAQRWSEVAPRLRRLPAERFDTAEERHPRVDRKSRVCVLRNFYSVPTAYVGRQVSVTITGNTVAVSSCGQVIARHERLEGVAQQSLELDHYLEWLQRKPGAFGGSKVLGQARRKGCFPACYERLWAALRDRYGDAEGTRQLLGVLLLLREHADEEVSMAIELALGYGCADQAAVENILRQLRMPSEPERGSLVDLGALVAYERPAPDLRRYDAWCRGEEVH